MKNIKNRDTLQSLFTMPSTELAVNVVFERSPNKLMVIRSALFAICFTGENK